MKFQRSRKWTLYLTLMIINSNMVLPEAAGLYGSIEPAGGELLQADDDLNARYQLEETARVDPLDHFNKYRGGYDLRNKYYWSSTIFTGIYGYAIGLLWLVAGVLFAMYLAVASCSRRSNRNSERIICQKQCYLFPIILTTVLAVLAIIASGVALGGTAQFHSRAKTVMNTIIDAADQASNTMYNATDAMREISVKLHATDDVDGAIGASEFLASTSDKLDYEATNIKRQARKNRHLVEKGLTIMYICTIIAISLNLVIVIALLVSGILRFRLTLRMLITLCWILTSMCWLLFGAYFFLAKFSGDTCTALQDFQQRPDTSSLGSILPCDELHSAQSILSDVSMGIYEVVDQVNLNISLLKSNSYPDLEYVCNPFSGPPDYVYQPEKCPADTIQIGDIPQVLKLFTCSDAGGTSCKQGEFITLSQYNTIQAYTTSIQNLLEAYPEMESLVECQLVKNAFSEILANHCKPLKRNAKTTWIATLFLSSVMVIFLLTWISTSCHEVKQHSVDSLVKPNIEEGKFLDSVADKETNKILFQLTD